MGIFGKLGEARAKGWIPFYNFWLLLKYTCKTRYFWWTVILSVAASVLDNAFDFEAGSFGSILGLALCLAVFVVRAIACYYISRSFGKGVAFTICMVLFFPIMLIVLGYGSAQYIGNACAKPEPPETES